MSTDSVSNLMGCLQCGQDYDRAALGKTRQQFGRLFAEGWCRTCLGARGRCLGCRKVGYIARRQEHLCSACVEASLPKKMCRLCGRVPVAIAKTSCGPCRAFGCASTHGECLLSLKCCWCRDERPFQAEGTYLIYIDGLGEVKNALRGQFYCETCRPHHCDIISD